MTSRTPRPCATPASWSSTPPRLCTTEPALALTHMPLRRVPLTAINVHGHLHGVPAPSPRHLNVCVERTNYAPVRLD